MDVHTPLTPDLDGFRARVLAVKPHRVYVCCVCHHNLINGYREGGSRLCADPACHVEARRLGWER